MTKDEPIAKLTADNATLTQFTFLYNLDVPPDNNASERAVRNVKVKQKISGQFKSGQDTFCVLRSVIDTLIKRELNVLNKLKIIMSSGVPE